MHCVIEKTPELYRVHVERHLKLVIGIKKVGQNMDTFIRIVFGFEPAQSQKREIQNSD